MQQKKSTFTVKRLAYCGLFAALLTICAWMTVPSTIPFTMQTFSVFLTAALLGWKLGSLSVLVYILLGAVGVPVFSGFRDGFGVLLGTTGGYIVGFLVSVPVTALLIDRLGRTLPALCLAMLAGLVVCYAFGTVWFLLVYTHNTGTIGIHIVLSKCVYPYILPDCAKILLAALLSRRLKRFVTL